jgi:hypothetical protein
MSDKWTLFFFCSDYPEEIFALFFFCSDYPLGISAGFSEKSDLLEKILENQNLQLRHFNPPSSSFFTIENFLMVPGVEPRSAPLSCI